MTPLTYSIIALTTWLVIIVAACISSEKAEDVAGWSAISFAPAFLWPLTFCVITIALIPFTAYYLNIAIRKRIKP